MDEDEPLERTTLALAAKRPVQGVWAWQSYAVMASRDNQLGTLYEIGVVRNVSGEGDIAVETLHFVMHDPERLAVCGAVRRAVRQRPGLELF